MNNIEITEGELGSFTKEYLLDLPVPSVVGFQGSLGAGKTTIIKNIIRNLGIEEMVTSPTFNIVRSYNKEDLDIYHVDLYSCLLYTSPSPRDGLLSRMPSSA